MLELISLQSEDVKKDKNMRLKNCQKVDDSEYSCDNDSDFSDDITEIDDCIYIDDEDVNSFISTDINENTIQKFLQREMDFYKKAFPQDILIRKSSR